MANEVFEMGQVGSIMPDGVTTILKYTTKLNAGRDFWGFYTIQSWGARDVLNTFYTGQGPGLRTIQDIKVITYRKSVIEGILRRFVAFNTFGVQSVRFYDNAI